MAQDAPTCATCGARLQGTRCPWSSSSRQAPGPGGVIYCDWPRVTTVPPMYTVSRSRRGPA